MGLISKTVKTKWVACNTQYYINKGYKYTKQYDEFEVKVEDLSNGSNVYIEVQCDICGVIKKITWQNYKKYVKEDGEYHCKRCVKERVKNTIKTKLINSKSFYDWCIEHNRLDILNRWNYELNGCSPKDVLFGTAKKYYFKCPKGIHPSELKHIVSFTSGQEGSIECIACNSIGQYLLDTYGQDALEKYWDYEKNNKLGLDPFEINKGSHKKIWIKCQDVLFHDSYFVQCNDFVRGNRCPQCKKSKGEKRIEEYLINNNFVKDIDYIPQKEFEGLIGLGGKNLSYDFYLPQYNLLIEYQGEFHDGTVRNQSKKKYQKQVEHDRRKAEYADNHNIKLLPIWYYNFDNIEKILDEELKIINKNNFKEVI